MTKQENIYNVYNKGSVTTYQRENVGKWEKKKATKSQKNKSKTINTRGKI